MTTFTAYSVHTQRMPISTTPQIEVTLSQSDWHKVGSVDGRSANRVIDHVIGDRKCMEKRNTVDRRSILNIKLIEDQ